MDGMEKMNEYISQSLSVVWRQSELEAPIFWIVGPINVQVRNFMHDLIYFTNKSSIMGAKSLAYTTYGFG